MHHLIKLCCCCIIFMATSQKLPAQETGTEALIEQLKADDPVVRESALKALLDRGKSVLSALETAAKGPGDLDFKAQLERVIGGIHDNAKLAKLRGEKRITQNFEQMPLKDVLQKLESHFGWKIAYDGKKSDHKIDCEMQNLTFYEATEKLRQVAQLAYVSEVREDGMAIFPGFGGGAAAQSEIVQLQDAHGTRTQSAQALGPLLCFVQRVTVQKTLDPGSGKESIDLRVLATVQAEPGLPELKFELAELTLVDAQGNRFSHADDGMGRLAHFMPLLKQATQTHPLQQSLKGVTEVHPPYTFSGNIKVTMPLNLETKSIDAFDKLPQTLKTENGNLELISVDKKTVKYHIPMSLYTQLENHQNHLRMAMRERERKADFNRIGIYWLDAAGRELYSGSTNSSGDNDGFTVTRTFNAPPVRLVLVHPREFISQSYPFELKHITLPE